MCNIFKYNLEPYINVCWEEIVATLRILKMHYSGTDRGSLVFSIYTTLVLRVRLVLNGSFLFTELPYDPTQGLSLHSD